MGYQETLASIPEDARNRVPGAVAALASCPDHRQVASNIEDETALAEHHFRHLLEDLADATHHGLGPAEAWRQAFQGSRLRGAGLPPAQCPQMLGRVKTLATRAIAVAGASNGSLTKAEAEHELRGRAGQPALGWAEPFIRAALLGRTPVWVTFDRASPGSSPFLNLPPDREGLRVALGLGHVRPDEPLVLLACDYAKTGAPSLHRPTVADAGAAPHYYRPRPAPQEPWGLTAPLAPNVRGLAPQPELVMPECPCAGLALPFQVV